MHQCFVQIQHQSLFILRQFDVTPKALYLVFLGLWTNQCCDAWLLLWRLGFLPSPNESVGQMMYDVDGARHGQQHLKNEKPELGFD
jgi:hypothetical protein